MPGWTGSYAWVFMLFFARKDMIILCINVEFLCNFKFVDFFNWFS